MSMLTDQIAANTAKTQRTVSGYVPIRDYALIGDCHGCALVSSEGSVDWCALGRFDAAPIFCRLLDATKGGFLSVKPSGRFAVERAYIENTNILRTVFTTDGGRASVTDYMPVGRRPGAGIHDYTSLAAPAVLVRTIEGVGGRVELDLAFRPSVEFARRAARLAATEEVVFADPGPALHADVAFRIHGDTANARMEIAAGEKRHMIVSATRLPATVRSDAVDRLFATTSAFWREWLAYTRYRGPYQEIVQRSALVLKLLTYAPSGAIIAAPTTSLPEEIGGARNWDYRYCWLRDASFTLYALAVLGYSGEAKAFGRFLRQVCRQRPDLVQVMYGIEGEATLHETVLKHLEGYSDSSPVRVGNAAYRQRQIDVYGEILDWAHLTAALGGSFDDEDRSLLHRLAAFAAAHADDPDQGLWETRSEPRHYVHGKLMSWVALDRALRLLGDNREWRSLRDRLGREVLDRGVDPRRGHLVQAYDHPNADAALLLVPMLGFPVDRAMLERTTAAVERELRRGDYVERYRSDDGVPGRHGGFLICSFWLVDAYLALGRRDDARALYERLLVRANDVGLFAEAIEPTSHAFLGNFPQGFTHLALIGNAIHFELCEKYGDAAIVGTHADRARRAVGATFGWRAVWEACKASGRVGRLWSSRRSLMHPEPCLSSGGSPQAPCRVAAPE
jgi:alpha,alpha-trehalase